MSLREQTLQHRVDALEECVASLAMTIRSHLPAATGMVDSALTAIENAGEYVEQRIAQTLGAHRVNTRAQRETAMDTGELNQLLRIYVPLLLMLDKDERFLKKLKSGGPYSYTNDPYELDLSQIARDAHYSQQHAGILRDGDPTRMTLHLSSRGGQGFYVDAISGTQKHIEEWVSYSVKYDGVSMPLFELEFIDAMAKILRALDKSDYMIDPNFELHGTNGVVHGLTLNHHTWSREGKILGEPIEGRGAVLQPKNPIDVLGVDYRIMFWKDNPELEIEIVIEPKNSDSFRLQVIPNSQTLSLRKYGSDDRQMRPKDLGILNRARLKYLIQFVVELMKDERDSLLWRDPTGVAVDWEMKLIPYPEEA